MYYYQCRTMLGQITIYANEIAVTKVVFNQVAIDQTIKKNTAIITAAFRQLDEYLQGTRKSFELNLEPHGSEFQIATWQQLSKIPYGETQSYQTIAAKLNRPAACRAVGNACRNNPIPIFLPCHRVIGADGKLTGYAGGLPIKEKLLNLERAFS